ncbi:MAG: succinylglutamate desuccinylase/aspartoacylase family protein [Pseudomonadota bacterium]
MSGRAVFEIAGRSVTPGTSEIVEIPVSTLPDYTRVALQVKVHHGRRKGPVLFVSAAVHRDEVSGVEIVRRLLRAPGLFSLRGTLLAVPIVNANGFLARSRYLPDRRDLYRCFPGHPSGSLESRLALIFLEQLVDRADVGVDLHSAAVHRTNLPQIRISPGDAKSADIAQVFGAPVILTSPLRDGSLRSEAAARAKAVLLYEAGEGLRFEEFAVQAGVAGILRVMHALKMLPAKGISSAKAAPYQCKGSNWLRAPTGGLFRPFRAEGDVVREGELLASIADPFGGAEADLIAPTDGILIGRAVPPVMNEGDAVFHIASIDAHDTSDSVDSLAA